MSRTSTDSALAESARADAGGRRFTRVLAVTIVALVALCAAFVTIGYLQGPKLASAQVDTSSVVEQSSQQLRLFANQALAQVAPEQVTITPSTDFTVSTSGDIIAVQFGERLDYATEYTVSVHDVTSLYTPQTSTLTYRFTTAAAQVHYLVRGEPVDEVVRTTSAGTDRQVVYSAAGIQDFVALGRALVVSSFADDDTSVLDLVSVVETGVQRIALPSDGIIGQLQASSSGTIAGFTMTDGAREPGTPLYIVDLEASGGAQPVLDLDGSPLRVSDWRFVPGTASLLALSGDNTLLFIDPAAGTVLPLGQYQALSGVTPDGTHAIVADTFGPVLLTLADGSEERIELAAVDGENAYLGAMLVLPDGTIVAKAVLASDFAPVVVRAADGVTNILYRTVRDAGSIQDIVASPNGQYVAIETVPDTSASESDGYPADARSTSSTTVIVDVDSGVIVSSFTGFAPAW